MYRVFVPKQAVGASKIYFDIWNTASSGLLVELVSCLPVVSGAVAVTGVVGVDLHLQRTTAVGTGGTAMTREGTALDAMTASCIDGTQKWDLTRVSGRLTPTGGATAGAVLSWECVFTEETNAATYVVAADMVRTLNDLPAVVIPEGSGISIVQGSVASVGNIGFNLILRLRNKS